MNFPFLWQSVHIRILHIRISAGEKNVMLLMHLEYKVMLPDHDFVVTQLFHDGGRYHVETSPLICRANKWTAFYMITASVMKGLTQIKSFGN